MVSGSRQQDTTHSLRSAAKSSMKSVGLAIVVMLTVTLTATAKELPEAPSNVMMSSSFAVESTRRVPPPNQTKFSETHVVDAKFVSFALISTGSTFADSYTTLFARQNWIAGKTGVCNAEVQSVYLYGTHPTVGRTYGVAAVKSVGSLAAAYYLRKHHSKFWSVPLLANSIISLQGVTQNMRACN